MIWIKIKRTNESFSRVDLWVPLMGSDLTDLRSLILVRIIPMESILNVNRVRRRHDVWVAPTLPLPPLLWVWESTARRWRLWDAADSSCDDTADAADLRRLWLWQSWLSLEDEAVDSEDFFPIPRLSAMLSKPSSERYFLPLKSSLMKNSFDGRLDLVLLCPWPSLIQYPLTRCRIMLAQAFSKSCWSRTFSSSWLCSPSSWWWPSSSNSLKMSSAEKHWKYKEEY